MGQDTEKRRNLDQPTPPNYRINKTGSECGGAQQYKVDRFHVEQSAFPVLLAYAETGKNLSQQIIWREFPGNRRQRFLRQTQFFSKQFQMVPLGFGGEQARQGILERLEVSLSGQKDILGARLPPRDP